MASYYENELSEDALAFLPEDVREALLKLAEFQHKTGTEIKFGWTGPRPAEKYLPAQPEHPCITIANLPRKAVLQRVTVTERGKRDGEPPQLFLQNFSIDGRSCLLWVIGDREKNIKDKIRREMIRDKEVAARYMADQLVRNAKHPMGELDFDGVE